MLDDLIIEIDTEKYSDNLSNEEENIKKELDHLWVISDEIIFEIGGEWIKFSSSLNDDYYTLVYNMKLSYYCIGRAFKYDIPLIRDLIYNGSYNNKSIKVDMNHRGLIVKSLTL